jgi:hypothetical protein
MKALLRHTVILSLIAASSDAASKAEALDPHISNSPHSLWANL